MVRPLGPMELFVVSASVTDAGPRMFRQRFVTIVDTRTYSKWDAILFKYCSLDLLSLQLYRLFIHEYPLPLIWLWYPPRSDLCRELLHHLLLDAL